MFTKVSTDTVLGILICQLFADVIIYRYCSSPRRISSSIGIPEWMDYRVNWMKKRRSDGARVADNGPPLEVVKTHGLNIALATLNVDTVRFSALRFICYF